MFKSPSRKDLVISKLYKLRQSDCFLRVFSDWKEVRSQFSLQNFMKHFYEKISSQSESD